MRGSYVAAAFIPLAAVALAQTPPVGAKDITQLPPTAAAAAPSATIAAPASVIRIYVDNLSGSDSSALAGLITQTLFESKRVVVTENESNASLILKGLVLRQPIAASVPSSASAVRHARAQPHKTAGAGASSPEGLPMRSLDTPAAAATAASDDGLPSGLDLAPLAGLDAADLTHFRYRLDLQVVNPDGDVVWMSGRGNQALPFQDADDAVARTLQPLLAALAALKPGAGQ